MALSATFQDDEPDEPRFAPVLNTSRPDATYQINATWEQFQYDLDVVDKGCLLHVARAETWARRATIESPQPPSGGRRS